MLLALPDIEQTLGMSSLWDDETEIQSTGQVRNLVYDESTLHALYATFLAYQSFALSGGRPESSPACCQQSRPQSAPVSPIARTT